MANTLLCVDDITEDDSDTINPVLGQEKQITDLLLIIETCQTNVHNNFNIKLIAKHIKIDNILTGKKMCDYVEEGYINKKQQHASIVAPTLTEKDSDNNSYINNSAQGKKRQDFSNQMTIVIRKEKTPVIPKDNHEEFDYALYNAIKVNPEPSNLNLKIFRTGSIIITGGLCQSDCHYAVTEFLKRIGNIREEYRLSNSNYEIEKMFGILANINIGDDKNIYGNFADVKDNIPLKTYVEFVYSHMQVLLYFFIQFDINYNLNLDKIIESKSKKKIIAFNSLIDKTSPDYYKFTRLVKCILTCNMYCSPETIYNMLDLNCPQSAFTNGIHTLVYKFIRDLYMGSTVELRATLEPEVNFNFDIICVNYNSKLLCSFQINRSKLSDILNSHYVSFSKVAVATTTGALETDRVPKTKQRKQKVNNRNRLVANIKPSSLIQAEFNLNDYPGIKCNYVTSDGKSIAILIFQSGKIIITGCNAWSQNCEGYKFIKDILLKYYDEINYIGAFTPEQTPLPHQGTQNKKVIKFSDYTYINKDIYINKNPYNAKIAKEYALYSV